MPILPVNEMSAFYTYSEMSGAGLGRCTVRWRLGRNAADYCVTNTGEGVIIDSLVGAYACEAGERGVARLSKCQGRSVGLDYVSVCGNRRTVALN